MRLDNISFPISEDNMSKFPLKSMVGAIASFSRAKEEEIICALNTLNGIKIFFKSNKFRYYHPSLQCKTDPNFDIKKLNTGDITWLNIA